MLFIIFASIFASIGTFILRKGDIFNIFNALIKFESVDIKLIIFTAIGIFLNLIAIALWQYSSKSQIPFNTAFSSYLSLTLIMGYFVDYFFGNSRFEINLFIGACLIISGIIISNKSFNYF